MDDVGKAKNASSNGAAMLKDFSGDEVDGGALCCIREISSSEISTEPKTFEVDVPSPFDVGRIIQIEGAVPFGIERFQINLCSENVDNIIALHLSVRFKHRVVVRNSFQDGSWGIEEVNGPFPFASGEKFSLHVLVQSDNYHIAVNGQHCWEFIHRLPYVNVTSVNVIGPVTVDSVEFPSVMSKDPREIPATLESSVQRVVNPSVPFSHTIPGGLKPGMKITITGRPFVSVHRFTINLQCGIGPYPPPDIAFHFDARAFSHSVVRNTRRNNNWETEEVTTSSFPFQPGVHFEIIIGVEGDKYVLTINNKLFTEYIHRLTQLPSIDTLKIGNDIILSSVVFE